MLLERYVSGRLGYIASTATHRLSGHTGRGAILLRHCRFCSTGRTDEEVNRDFYTISNRFRTLSEIISEAGATSVSQDDARKYYLEFESRNPLIKKYGIKQRDLTEGAPHAIKRFIELVTSMSPKDFRSIEGPYAEALGELTDFVGPVLLEEECLRVVDGPVMRRYILKEVEVAEPTLMGLETTIVPTESGRFLYRLLNFVNKRSLLFDYPPGSVAVKFTVEVAVREVREMIDYSSKSSKQRIASEQAANNTAAEDPNSHVSSTETNSEGANISPTGNKVVEKRYHMLCKFVGCVSGQIPLEWQLESALRHEDEED
jgi:hypothetical protein